MLSARCCARCLSLPGQVRVHPTQLRAALRLEEHKMSDADAAAYDSFRQTASAFRAWRQTAVEIRTEANEFKGADPPAQTLHWRPRASPEPLSLRLVCLTEDSTVEPRASPEPPNCAPVLCSRRCALAASRYFLGGPAHE